MLSTNDAGILFSAFKASYGHQWAHTTEAIPVWQNALSRFTAREVMKAANEAVVRYRDHPPTLGQFVAILKPPPFSPAPNTYLPPPVMSPASAQGNRAMMRVLLTVHGVDRKQLRLMIALKNALVEDHGEEHFDKDAATDLEQQLRECANGMDKEARAAETIEAAKRFRIRQGMPSL